MTRSSLVAATLVALVAIAPVAGAQEIGTFEPMKGYRVVKSDKGALNIRIFSYFRYLNQGALEDTYNDEFGNTKALDLRQDMQLNKVNIYFLGWVMDPKFRYSFYVWTANTSQGQAAQVVVAGSLTYAWDPRLNVGFGISALPGVRSTEGSFPYWLTVDNRLVADAYFQPSYTTGIWLSGELAEGLEYKAMLGNNLSQLGVDAMQLDNDLETWSVKLAWMPTTGEYGNMDSFGDFEEHAQTATRIGVHYTASDENAQGQPDTDAIENSQIRVSDGSIIFTPFLFGSGIRITDATYHMTSVDAGVKYNGFALEGELYWRWVNNFRGPGTENLAFDELEDHGFQLQASAMVLPQSLQAYAAGSKIFGEYGDPWDLRLGINWFPWENPSIWWNHEFMYTEECPVGASSLPYVVGADGWIYYTSFLIFL